MIFDMIFLEAYIDTVEVHVKLVQLVHVHQINQQHTEQNIKFIDRFLNILTWGRTVNKLV
jgi:hypothetical protein